MMTKKELSLKQVTESIIGVIKQLPEPSTSSKDFKLLTAFSDQLSDSDSNVVSFDIYQFAEALGKSDKEEVRKEANRVIRLLSHNLEKHRPAIETRLHKADVREYLEVERIKNTSVVRLSKTPINAQQSSLAADSTPNLIQYEPKTERSIFGEFEFNISKRFAFTSLLILFLILGGFYAVWYFVWVSNAAILPGLTACVLYALITYKFLSPIFKAFDRGVHLAPFWLKPTLIDNAFLLFSKGSGGHRVKVSIKTFKAACPICGNKVTIREGKRHLKGRLVGQCELTQEHTYTFDHIKERGVPANSPMYIPN